MTLKTVYGILPYVQVERELDDAWGSAKGPYVRLDPRAPAHSAEHEAEHVRQFYKDTGAGVMLGVGLGMMAPALLWLIPAFALLVPLLTEKLKPFDVRSEAEAYATSVKNGRSLMSAARALKDSEPNAHARWSLDRCKREIKERL